MYRSSEVQALLVYPELATHDHVHNAIELVALFSMLIMDE